MLQWLGYGANKEEENADSAENENAGGGNSGNSAGGGGGGEGSMLSGAIGFMKGILGMEQLKVEEAGDVVNNTDIDENKRKGLFRQLSSYIGKDITSMISLPVWIFEPVSFLQVMSEPLQYEYLLQKANECENSLDRLAYVAAFNCALYSTAIRTRKPFNPLLGETFEILQKENKFRFIAEQVSHHPPIGVSQTESKHYILNLETELKSKFYGNSSEIIIMGTNHLRLSNGSHISWGHLTTACHNIIIGSLWLDHYGDLTIENHTTGEKCVMKFQKAGWLGAGRYAVTGEIFDQFGGLRIKLHGKWNEALYGQRVDGDKFSEDYLIWEASREIPDNKFHFPRFVNEEVINLTPEYLKILPTTDSRLRQDRRLLELGELDQASRCKHEMEEAQRARKREREARGESWSPKYFEKVEDSKFGHQWKFNSKYWEEREERVRRASENTADGLNGLLEKLKL